MIVSKAWFLAKSPGVNGLMQVRICTMYITYMYKIKCQGKTDEGKTTVEIVKNMQKTWRIFCQTRQVDWQPELTCSCGHLCSACLFLTTKEKIRLKYFITVEKKIIINNNNNKFFVMYLLDELFHLSWPQFYLGKHNAIWVHWCQWHMPHVLSNQWTEWKSCYTVQSANHMMVQVTKLYQCSILSTIADTKML